MFIRLNSKLYKVQFYPVYFVYVMFGSSVDRVWLAGGVNCSEMKQQQQQ